MRSEVPAEPENQGSFVTIRKLREIDLDTVLAIEAEAPEAANWSKESYLSLLGEEGSVAFVAVAEGQVVGFLVGRKVADQADVFNLAVKYEHRGNGFGSRLLVEALRHFAFHRVQRVFLDVRPSNTKAIAFYEKHGFSGTGERKGYYRNPDEPALIMQKKLTAQDQFPTA